MALFQDLFLRDTFSDTGQEPVTDAAVSASPDIIPYGQQKLTQQELISTYGPPLLHLPVENNQINNIYVRAKSNAPGATSGKIRVYYSQATLLTNVNAWRSQMLPNNNGMNWANVTAAQSGQIAPGDQPFHFTPATSLGSHFCFIGTVETPAHGDPMPSGNFDTWQQFVDWVRAHANVAWHNVDVVNSLPPKGFINAIAFTNISASAQFFGFKTVYTNMPAESQLRLYSLPGSGYTGFDTGVVTIGDVNGSIGAGAIFPGNFTTSIFTTCTFPGSPLTPPRGVTIRTTSLGYQPNMSDPSNARFRDIAWRPNQVKIDAPAFDTSGDGGFVEITSYSALFNPGAETTLPALRLFTV